MIDRPKLSADNGGGYDRRGDCRPRPLGADLGRRSRAKGTGLASRPAGRDPAAHRAISSLSASSPVATLDAALADDGIDAIVLATPHSSMPTRSRGRRRGKAVFSEKPLTLTSAEAERAWRRARSPYRARGRRRPALLSVDGGAGASRRERQTQSPAPYRGQFQQRGGGDDVLAVTRFARPVARRQDGRRRHPPLNAMSEVAGTVRRYRRRCCRAAPRPIHSTRFQYSEFRSGVSGMLGRALDAAVLARPCLRRDGSAEALGRTELVLRRSGEKPRASAFPSRLGAGKSGGVRRRGRRNRALPGRGRRDRRCCPAFEAIARQSNRGRHIGGAGREVLTPVSGRSPHRSPGSSCSRSWRVD